MRVGGRARFEQVGGGAARAFRDPAWHSPRMTRRLLVAALLASATLAHADPVAPAPPPTGAVPELSAADAAKLVGFLNGVLDAMIARKADCAQMAGAIDDRVTRNAPMLRAVMKQLSAGAVLPADAQTKISDRMTAHAQDLAGCAADPAVNAAMARIHDPDLPAGPSPAVRAQVKAPVAADLATYTKKLKGAGALIATITTPSGTVRCQLLPDKAPITVANFVGLATGQKPWLDPKTNKVRKNKPYYDGQIFHRVIPDFMIQGGDPTGTGAGGPGYQFGDESSDVKMAPGVLAMANAGPATNGSQFFITEGTPSYLDGKHTIFGQCAPLDVVKAIARVPRGSGDRPDTAVTMKVTISRGAL